VGRPWVSVGAASLAAFVFAPSMILQPYTFVGSAYEYALLLADIETWGWIYGTVACLYLGGILSPSWKRRRQMQKWLTAVLAGLLLFLFVFWAGMLTAARIDPDGTPSTWLGPGFMLFLAYAHGMSFARFGPGRE
jgi:hypothetical protein